MPVEGVTQVQRITQKQNWKNVLTHAYENPTGYMRDLKAVDQREGEAVESLKSAGLIKTGYTKDAETYGLTKLGKEYFNDFLLDEYRMQRIKKIVKSIIPKRP